MGGRGALVGAGLLVAAAVTTGVVTQSVRADPPVADNPGGVASVGAGSSVTCAVIAVSTGADAAKCWGVNTSGQLGRNNKVSRGDGTEAMETLGPIALAFDVGDAVAEVALGAAHACARSSSGDVICWGHNADGQLGIGSTATRGDGGNEMAMLVPLTIGAGRVAARVTVGDAHSCILSVSRDVTCWGLNDEGQLGIGDVDSRGDEPGEMASLGHVALGGPVAALSSGANHVCAVMDAGGVVCWGANTHGQLGRGDTDSRGITAGDVTEDGLVPLPLAPGEEVSQVSAGGSHTCALTDAGNVWCWGRNNRGQLGLGDVDARGDGPGEIAALAPVPLPGDATAVSAGHEHTCALLTDDTVRCWGNGALGRLGYGSEDSLGDDPGEVASLSAVPMAGSRHAVSVSAGRFHTCIRRDDGTAICWGSNSNGELGQDNDQTRGDGPGEVASLAPIVLTPPEVVLDAVSTTSAEATARFDLTADEPLDCATVSDTAGTDLTVTSAVSMSVSQHAPETCRVSVVSTVADGASGTVTVALAASFAVADATGQVTTRATLGDLTVTIDRTVPATTPPTTPTTTPPTTPTTTVSTTTPPPLSVRVGRSVRITRVLNRAAVSAPSLSRVWVKVRPASRRICGLRAGKVTALRAGTCRLAVTVVGARGSTTRHGATLIVVRR